MGSRTFIAIHKKKSLGFCANVVLELNTIDASTTPGNSESELVNWHPIIQCPYYQKERGVSAKDTLT